MKSAMLTVLIVMTGMAVSVSLHAAGFRPGKVFHPSHARAALSPARHHTMLDLEKDAPKSKPNLEEDSEKHVQELVQKASSHMQELESKFKAVKDDMAAIKSAEDALVLAHARPHTSEQTKAQAKDQAKEQAKEVKAHKPAQKAAAVPAKPKESTAEKQSAPADDFAAADADASFIQFEDNMNNGVEDEDDSPVPRARRMSLNFLLSKPTPTPEKAHIFGLAGDGSQRTFDIKADGTPVVYPQADEPTLDPTMEGKKENTTAEPDMEKDLVCVCKRHRAPRGEDRIRCKKNATPTPTPTPTPTAVRGVRQCVNGTWGPDASNDAGVSDVICIYWPTQMPLLQLNPTPTPTPSGATPDDSNNNDQDLPPECYDERNEFVADGVVEKRKYDVLLLQDGFETCNC